MNDFLIEIEVEEFDVDWPGWELTENKFGDEFDREARVRMILGSRKLVPYIKKYSLALRPALLEIGPFFNPLLICKDLAPVIPPGTSITFLENDPFAMEWLEGKQQQVLNIDLNNKQLKKSLQQQIRCLNLTHGDTFNVIVLSQVLNYVSAPRLFQALHPFLNHDGLLFINNVANYGLPQLFSRKRPRHNEDIEKALLESGFNILEYDVLAKEFDKEPEGRAIFVAAKF